MSPPCSLSVSAPRRVSVAGAAAALAGVVTLTGLALLARDASAFGGSARNFEREGNFVVTNNANFGFAQKLNGRLSTVFDLRPALDYMIIPSLTIGGAVEFVFTAPETGPNTTQFVISPDVGYDLSLSDTVSFWPQARLNLVFRSDGNPLVQLVLFAPFLLHPVEHFFFGIGPGFSQDLTANANTFITGGFVIGGYFDH
jgi:hypothetical protein